MPASAASGLCNPMNAAVPMLCPAGVYPKEPQPLVILQSTGTPPACCQPPVAALPGATWAMRCIPGVFLLGLLRCCQQASRPITLLMAMPTLVFAPAPPPHTPPPHPTPAAGFWYARATPASLYFFNFMGNRVIFWNDGWEQVRLPAWEGGRLASHAVPTGPPTQGGPLCMHIAAQDGLACVHAWHTAQHRTSCRL